MTERVEANIIWKEQIVMTELYVKADVIAEAPRYIHKLKQEIIKTPYYSNCGKRTDDRFMHYCPNCGAKFVDELGEV